MAWWKQVVSDCEVHCDVSHYPQYYLSHCVIECDWAVDLGYSVVGFAWFSEHNGLPGEPPLGEIACTEDCQETGV